MSLDRTVNVDDSLDQIVRYFPYLEPCTIELFRKLAPLYNYWNALINVISRKDMQHFYQRHVLHSLAIARVQPFEAGSDILDIGTGGGFPGIPLAILYPQVHFHLVDSIGKKIKVVEQVVEQLGLKNVKATHGRAENVSGQYDFIVSRAVAAMADFVPWTRRKIKTDSRHQLSNGILYLKGGDLSEELKNFPQAKIFPIKDFFDGEFFETKSVVYLPE